MLHAAVQREAEKKAKEDATPTLKKLADLEAEAAPVQKKIDEQDAVIKAGQVKLQDVEKAKADYEKEKLPAAKAAAAKEQQTLQKAVTKAEDAERDALTLERMTKEKEVGATRARVTKSKARSDEVWQEVVARDDAIMKDVAHFAIPGETPEKFKYRVNKELIAAHNEIRKIQDPA